ncbi:uncharacterized protein LOC113857433 [Abrus precatorius]|uniref:Uncharacterized protein LOC113857433 n=1 Tax=Abrus precatorius TaxID=3816 RepID=A0A8B8KMS3_ABRPR|nr:uncharacterized protein LOC113857433 [Abrus precatorius]
MCVDYGGVNQYKAKMIGSTFLFPLSIWEFETLNLYWLMYIDQGDYPIFLCMQKKPVKMSVPQFGGWEHKSPGVPSDYSMVFNQARANKKNQKNDLSEVKRLSLGNERGTTNPKHRHGHGHGHGQGHGHGHGHGHEHEEPPVMRRKKGLNYMNCCIMA